MVNKLDKSDIRKRKAQILEFFRKHPFSGKSAMYKEIPKYSITTELFNKLVHDKKIKYFYSKNGEKKYYVEREWNPVDEVNKQYPLLNYHCQEIMYQVSQFSESHPEFKIMADAFRALIENRYRIIKNEIKNSEIPNIKFLEKDVDTLEIFLLFKGHALKLPHWEGMENTKGIVFQKQTIEKFTEYLNALVDFTQFFLDHSAHSFGSNEKKFRGITTAKRRTIHERLQMKFSGDNIQWGLKPKYFDKAIESISNGNITDYKEIIKRLGAERQSILTNNPEFSVYAHMFLLVFTECNSLPSNDSNREFLEHWWREILTIAAKRMENRLLNNDDTEIIMEEDPQTHLIYCKLVNDQSNLGRFELEAKKDLISVALMGEFD